MLAFLGDSTARFTPESATRIASKQPAATTRETASIFLVTLYGSVLQCMAHHLQHSRPLGHKKKGHIDLLCRKRPDAAHRRKHGEAELGKFQDRALKYRYRYAVFEHQTLLQELPTTLYASFEQQGLL